MSNHDPYSDSPSPLVGFSTTKVYSGIGADIVMESISLKSPQGRQMSVIEIFRQTAPERRMCHAGPVVLLGTRAWVERKVVGKK
jgi:hypothetical protein